MDHEVILQSWPCISHIGWKDPKPSRGEARHCRMDKAIQPVSTKGDGESTNGNGSVPDYAA